MRTLLTGELAQAQDSTSDYYVKLEIQNGSGTWIDVGAALGTHWLINVTFGVNVDQTVSQATFTLIDRIGAASMAPLMSTSPLNVDDHGAYAPLLDIGRLARANIATMAHGVALDVAKYREAFTGRIDEVLGADSTDFSGPITVTCSDLGAWLMDLQIETPNASYGSDAGIPLETVLQSILNANIPTTEPTVTLVKESASSFAATTFTQDAVKLLDALSALVLDSTGEDLRYRYDASHVSQLMWFNPDRTRVTVDATFAANQYLLRTLSVSIANVRNVIRMPYTDAATGGLLYATATDLPSVSKYRRRFNEIPASSLITDLTSAQKVVNAVANDLSDAPAQVAADLPFFFWPVQLYDRYTFTANNRQYDQDQTFGVVGYQHTIQNGQGATSLTLAGRIVGAYAAWLTRLADNGIVAQTASILRITPSESSDGTTATLALVVGASVDHVQAYYRTVARDTDPSLAADFSDGAVLPVDGMLLQRPVNTALSFDFPEPQRDERLMVRLVPFYLSPSGTYGEGESVVFPVEPAPPGIRVVIHAAKSGNLVDLSGTLTVGASDVPGTLQIIETVLGVDTTLLAITPILGNLAFDSGSYPSLANRVIPAGAEKVTWKGVFTDAAGVSWTFDGFTALPALVAVHAVPTEAAGVGTVTATVTDAGAYLDPTHVDGAVTSQVSWHVIALGVVTVVPSTTVPGGGATSGVYTLVRTLDPLHPIVVTGYVHYVDGSTESFGSWTFDSDKIANVLSAVPSIANQIATYVCNFDTDTVVGTGKARFRVDGGSWTTFDVAASYTGTFSFTMNGTSTQSVEVQGQSADGTWGPSLTVPMGTYNSAKTLRVGASEFKYSSGPALVLVNGYIHPATTGSGVYLGQIVGVPHGALITAFRARLYRQTGVGNAFLQVYKIDTSGVPSGPLGGSVLTHSTTGWQTLSLSVSETADGSVYSLYTTLEQLTEPTADSVRTTYAEVDYTVPDVSKPGAG